MGMLIRRHYAEQSEAEKPKQQRNRRGSNPAPAAPPADPPASPYAELTDDQVLDAYVLNVGGEDTERDAQVAALEALDAEGIDSE